MPKSIALEFETTHNKRNFLVEYEAYPNGRNLLMKVIHNDLPLDTVELRDYDLELVDHINNAMKNNAESYFETNQTLEHA